jgi:hypothetical protein
MISQKFETIRQVRAAVYRLKMKKTKQPLILTDNETTPVADQDAESFQNLLELEEPSEVVEILRQRLTSRPRKKERLAEDFFNEFFAENDPSP